MNLVYFAVTCIVIGAVFVVAGNRRNKRVLLPAHKTELKAHEAAVEEIQQEVAGGQVTGSAAGHHLAKATSNLARARDAIERGWARAAGRWLSLADGDIRLARCHFLYEVVHKRPYRSED